MTRPLQLATGVGLMTDADSTELLRVLFSEIYKALLPLISGIFSLIISSLHTLSKQLLYAAQENLCRLWTDAVEFLQALSTLNFAWAALYQ